MTQCASCNKPAVVHVAWLTSMGQQRANLCAEHAQYVQDRVIAREAVDASYSGGLTCAPVVDEEVV